MAELSPKARALLEAARGADDPSPAERARVDAAARAALARRGMQDLPPLSAAGSSAGWSFARIGPAVKIGIGAAGVLAALIGLRALQPEPADRAPSQPPPATSSQVPSSAPIPSRAPQPAVETKPSAPEGGRADAPVPLARPRRSAARAGGDGALQRELHVLSSADGLIRGAKFSDALALLERTDPGPVPQAMREERAALRILALCGLAPERAARDRARFLKSSPRSVLASRVRDACVIELEGKP